MLKPNYTKVAGLSLLTDRWMFVDRKNNPQGLQILRKNHISYHASEFVSETNDYKFVVVKTWKWKRKDVEKSMNELHKRLSLIAGSTYFDFLEDVEAAYKNIKESK